MSNQMPKALYFLPTELEEWEEWVLQHGRIDRIVLSWLLLGSNGFSFCWGSYEFSFYGYNDFFHDVRENS